MAKLQEYGQMVEIHEDDENGSEVKHGEMCEEGNQDLVFDKSSID